MELGCCLCGDVFNFGLVWLLRVAIAYVNSFNLVLLGALQWLEVLAEKAQKPRLVVFIPKMLAGLQSSLVLGFTA